MAIVRTIHSGGATVMIDDSCCAGVSRGEMARRWSRVDREIMRINRAHAARMQEEERGEDMDEHRPETDTVQPGGG